MQKKTPGLGDSIAATLSAFRVELAPYSPDWAARFEQEKALLQRVLSHTTHRLEHIGSTAVPGARAKPIVDIAVLLEDVQLVSGLIEPLAGLGYQYLEEFGLPGRHFFIKGQPRTFNLHVVDSRSGHWNKWLTFRNILRTHPDVLDQYLRLKDELARTFATQREKYTAAKTSFVQSVLDNPPA